MNLIMNRLCPVCSALLVFLQHRGNSRGFWICPVCAHTRLREPAGSEPEEDGTHPTDFNRPRGRRAA